MAVNDGLSARSESCKVIEVMNDEMVRHLIYFHSVA